MTLETRTLPEGWNDVPVSQLIERHFCGPSPDCEERPIVSDEEWGVLKTTAITWAGWNENAHKVLPRGYWERHDLVVKRGDVLITKAGPRDRVAVVVEVTSDPRNLIVSGKMIGLRPRTDEVLPKILASALTLSGPQKFIHARTTGMAESQVNFANTVLLDTRIPLPKLREQTRIAEVLDVIDATISRTEAVMAKFKHLRTGLLHDLVTRGLDEHGRVRPPFSKAPQLYRNSALGMIPREWRSCKLGEALQKPPRNGYSPLEAPSFRGRLLLGLGCLTPGGFAPVQLKNAPSDPGLDPFLLCDGDLLISRSNTLELVALPGLFRDVSYPCFYPDLMMRLVPKDELSSGFLELLLRYSPSRSRLVASASGTSGSMVKITGAGVMATPVAFPPIAANSEEQNRILTVRNEIDDYLNKTATELGKLQSLKAGLVIDLLAGKVRVPETLTLNEVSA
jgi:type I restriction enzyme S subunit